MRKIHFPRGLFSRHLLFRDLLLRDFLFRNLALLALTCMACTSAALAQVSATTQSQIQDTGISGLWVLANISFAGMRAQNHRSVLWRTLAFIFGLPGTIVSFFAVAEGSDRAYGIELPRRGRPSS